MRLQLPGRGVESACQAQAWSGGVCQSIHIFRLVCADPGGSGERPLPEGASRSCGGAALWWGGGSRCCSCPPPPRGATLTLRACSGWGGGLSCHWASSVGPVTPGSRLEPLGASAAGPGRSPESRTGRPKLSVYPSRRAAPPACGSPSTRPTGQKPQGPQSPAGATREGGAQASGVGLVPGPRTAAGLTAGSRPRGEAASPQWSLVGAGTQS